MTDSFPLFDVEMNHSEPNKKSLTIEFEGAEEVFEDQGKGYYCFGYVILLVSVCQFITME